MDLNSENNKKLNDFFAREYQSLKMYVKSRIRDTASLNAEDIIQDVALKLFSGADRYAPINNVAGFVYRSIKNRIIDVMRVANQVDSSNRDNELTDFVEIFNAKSNSYESEKMVTILKKCIEKLKPHYRDILIAVDFEGYTYKEISRETGIPEGTLMSRRHRAIGILSKKMELELNNYKN